MAEQPESQHVEEKNVTLSDLEKFLLYLAQNANPTRFLPFPDKYRKTPPVYQDEEKFNTKQKREGKVIPTVTLGASFAPYSPEEYEALRQDLDKFARDPNSNPYLRKYLSKLELGMVQHDNASLHPSIVEYEFRYSVLEERIREINYPKRWFLFHGSPLENWHSILRNGLRNMSNTTYMSDGATEGVGVYLADDIRTSYLYGSQGGYYGSQKGLHCVSVVEILTDPAPYKVPAGWYVIPDDKLLVVRYLLKISKPLPFDGKEILGYYTRMTNTRIKDTSIAKRIVCEERSFAKHGVQILEKTTPVVWTVLYDNTIIRLYLHAFPFQAPIVQLAYEVEGSDENPEYKAPYIPIDWTPAAGLVEVLITFKEHMFKGKPIPEMTSVPIKSLLIE